ncbi:MAG: rhomboid family intramembrane serine protease [Elusimicrobiota bacterium]
MFIILPFGRNTTLTKFPWFTVGLILINLVIFAFTWPRERHFSNEGVSSGELADLAYKLTDILLAPDSAVPEPTKTLLISEKTKEGFPTPVVEEIFRSVQEGKLGSSNKIQYKWGLFYPRYRAMRESLSDGLGNHDSLFFKYGFMTVKKLFPNIITYQFLHVGFFHVFFNMLFLWLVGCNIEERWGPTLFVSLYLLGGVAAALLQYQMYPEGRVPMVGASGSVSAIMGAFLVRHAMVKIKMFYFIMVIYFRYGVFEMPAWVALPLWFFQQLFMGLMTVKSTPQIGYWAHIGGFVFGALGGVLIRKSGLGNPWEEAADRTPIALNLKLDKARAALVLNDLDEAEKLFKEITGADTQKLKAQEGLLRIYEMRNDRVRFCRQADELIKMAYRLGQLELVNGVLDSVKSFLLQGEGNDDFCFALGATCEKISRWPDALFFYRRIAEGDRKSAYYPKTLFALGKLLIEKYNQRIEGERHLKTLLRPPYNFEWATIVEQYLKGLK